ncbi:ATP-binding protein [Halalkalibaculum sp. DA3122]|uniref:ATP-binding protein n=1 Tax=Halalkalibaculum sp. DA3122 TaxID=3373607 RepID=UPI003754BAD0
MLKNKLPGEVIQAIRLSDTGIGFDEEAQKHLFERFCRANESEVQEQYLGLPLVKAIVELYNGKIRVLSEGQGEGSTFVVGLSLARGLVWFRGFNLSKDPFGS